MRGSKFLLLPFFRASSSRAPLLWVYAVRGVHGSRVCAKFRVEYKLHVWGENEDASDECAVNSLNCCIRQKAGQLVCLVHTIQYLPSIIVQTKRGNNAIAQSVYIICVGFCVSIVTIAQHLRAIYGFFFIYLLVAAAKWNTTSSFWMTLAHLDFICSNITNTAISTGKYVHQKRTINSNDNATCHTDRFVVVATHSAYFILSIEVASNTQKALISHCVIHALRAAHESR